MLFSGVYPYLPGIFYLHCWQFRKSSFEKAVNSPGSEHIPTQGIFEDDFPFPKVGYVSCLEGISVEAIRNPVPVDR